MQIAFLSALLIAVAGCAPVGDPGYAVVFTNESNMRLVIQGKTRPEGGERAQWLLPPTSAGWVLYTIGDSRRAPPIDYRIVDSVSCNEVSVQPVDFSLAPDPGWTEFLVTVAADGRARLDASPSAAGEISGNLESTSLCPVK